MSHGAVLWESEDKDHERREQRKWAQDLVEGTPTRVRIRPKGASASLLCSPQDRQDENQSLQKSRVPLSDV